MDKIVHRYKYESVEKIINNAKVEILNCSPIGHFLKEININSIFTKCSYRVYDYLVSTNRCKNTIEEDELPDLNFNDVIAYLKWNPHKIHQLMLIFCGGIYKDATSDWYGGSQFYYNAEIILDRFDVDINHLMKSISNMEGANISLIISIQQLLMYKFGKKYRRALRKHFPYTRKHLVDDEEDSDTVEITYENSISEEVSTFSENESYRKFEITSNTSSSTESI